METKLEHRDAWREIDLDAVSWNAAALASLLAPGSRIAPIVKADAYGHGAVGIVRRLEAEGYEPFGVATLDAAAALRRADVRARIVCLYEVPTRAIADAADLGVECTIGSRETLAQVVASSPPAGSTPGWQLKLDTGLMRQGLRPEDVDAVAGALRAVAPRVTGVWTHLADGADPAAAGAQLELFDALVGRLRLLGISTPRHVAGSGAILAGHGVAYELARPGLALYGAVPAELTAAGLVPPVELRPVMAVRARAIRVVDVPAGTPVGYGLTERVERPSRLATVPIGYADGYLRTLGNGRGTMLAGGRRVPTVGRVSMDSLVVDVTDVPAFARGDVVTAIGEDGGERIGIESIAAAAGTIAQELGVALGRRLPIRLLGAAA
jgi:alanine racemase